MQLPKQKRPHLAGYDDTKSKQKAHGCHGTFTRVLETRHKLWIIIMSMLNIIMTQGHSILRLQERRRHWKHQHGNKWTLLVAIIMRLQKEEKLGVIYVTKMLCGTPRPPYIFSYERITSRNFAVKPPIHYISTKMETVVGFIFKGFCAYLNLF